AGAAPVRPAFRWTSRWRNLCARARLCIPRDSKLQRQAEARLAAAAVSAVGEREFSAMRFGDLPGQHETDAGPALLGREKRNEEIRGIGEAWAFVEHPDIELGILPRPADLHATLAFERGIGRIANNVDEELLELIRVR